MLKTFWKNVYKQLILLVTMTVVCVVSFMSTLSTHVTNIGQDIIFGGGLIFALVWFYSTMHYDVSLFVRELVDCTKSWYRRHSV